METLGKRAFDNVAQNYLASFLKYNPSFAAHWGIKGFDFKPQSYSKQAIWTECGDVEKAHLQLQKIDLRKLDAGRRLDYRVLKGSLEIDLHDIYNSNEKAIMSPEDFLPFQTLDSLIQRDVPDLARKLRYRIKDSQRNLIQAQQRLIEEEKYQPIEWAKTGISACEDGLFLLTDILKNSKIRRSKLYPSLQEEINLLRNVVGEYKDYLKNDLIPNCEGNFACGRDRFELGLKGKSFIDFSPEEIYAFGIKLFDETKKDIEDLISDTNYSYKGYLNMLKRNPSSKQDIFDKYVKYTSDALHFMQDHDLVSLDFDEYLEITNVPKFMAREFPFGAYGLPPLVGEQKGVLFINSETESSRLEQTNAFIKLTALHEGYPGHHLQCSLANLLARERGSSWVNLLNESSTMYEGWAVYCEQMMTEQEFISKKSENFIMLRDRLWRALRVQLDVDLHCNGLSYDSAVERMVDELGFTKEASELDINWYIEYPTVPAGYAVGWKMINLLREYEEDRLGNSFDLKNFHDNLISKGSIGLPLVIESTFGKEALTHVNREFRNYIK